MRVTDKLRAAIEQAKRPDVPIVEFRLHPDDRAALIAECEPMLQFLAAPGAPDQFLGVPIVEDESAERL